MNNNPTDSGLPAQPPPLLLYETWSDEQGHHARLHQELPRDALDYGCVQEVQASNATELTQEAARNRIKVWAWEASQGADNEDDEPFIWTGDQP